MFVQIYPYPQHFIIQLLFIQRHLFYSFDNGPSIKSFWADYVTNPFQFFSKPMKMYIFPHGSAGSIKEKFETICKKYFPGSASEDSFLLFPLSSKLFHYFPCTINLLMDRIASCKNTHKINFQFPGFLNSAKSYTGQILIGNIS